MMDGVDPAAEPDDPAEHDPVEQVEVDAAAEGVEHLQAAARELLAAARSFLDVVERVVEDPDRLGGAASSVVDLVRDGVGAAGRAGPRLEPWEQAAWSGASTGDDTDDDLADDDLVEHDLAEHAAPETAGPDVAAADDGQPAEAPTSTPRRRSRNGAAPVSRVRRISVD